MSAPILARGLLLTLGLAVFAGLGWRIGPEGILAYLQPLGWTALLVIPLYLLAVVLDVLGWRYTFDRPFPLGLLRLTGIHVIGKAVNLLTPLAPIGGEPLKAYLLHTKGIPLPEGLASVVVSKTLLTVAQGLFILAATGFAFVYLDLPAPLLQASLGTTAAGAALVGLFVLTQTRGLFTRLSEMLKSAGLRLSTLDQGARDLDGRIATYYRRPSPRLLTALGLHFLSWLAEGLEAYILLALLGLSPSVGFALALTALSSGVRAASFMVPAGLGIQEGGNVFIFLSFGLPAEAAMAFSLIRRLREVLWLGAGFVLLSWSGLASRSALTSLSPGVHEGEIVA
jgi:putative membrane protein